MGLRAEVGVGGKDGRRWNGRLWSDISPFVGGREGNEWVGWRLEAGGWRLIKVRCKEAMRRSLMTIEVKKGREGNNS